MISPSSLRAETVRALGYAGRRPASGIGRRRSWVAPRRCLPSWWIWHALPCMSRGAGTISPPKESTMPGGRGRRRATASSARAGELTLERDTRLPRGAQAPARSSCASASALGLVDVIRRCAARPTSAPSSPKQLDEVVGERVVVVDQQDHRHRSASARSMAASSAASLLRHSSCSAAGAESATMPRARLQVGDAFVQHDRADRDARVEVAAEARSPPRPRRARADTPRARR